MNVFTLSSEKEEKAAGLKRGDHKQQGCAVVGSKRDVRRGEGPSGAPMRTRSAEARMLPWTLGAKTSQNAPTVRTFGTLGALSAFPLTQKGDHMSPVILLSMGPGPTDYYDPGCDAHRGEKLMGEHRHHALKPL